MVAKKNNQIINKKISRELILKIYEYASKLRKDKNIGQRKIAREIVNKFRIDVSESTISGWIHKNNIPFVNEKTQFKPKAVPAKSVLEHLYVKQNLSASKIAKKFNVSTITLITWIKGYNIRSRTHLQSMNTKNVKRELAKLRLKKPTKDYDSLTPEKAYILGVLCGDGYIDSRSIKLEIRHDKEFIEEFTDCLEKVYGLKYKYSHRTKKNTFLLNISSMLIAKDLLRYSDFRTNSWNVSSKIMNSKDKKIIGNYLRGIYDSEGSISKYSITLSSVNYYGLLEISRLLDNLRIENKIRKYKYPVLVISKKRNLRLFKDLIGFTIKRKMSKLENTYKLGY